MENEYGWFMRVYGMSFVSSEILKPEPRKHKKIKAQNSEVGTNYGLQQARKAPRTLACTQPSPTYVTHGAQKTEENKGPNLGIGYKLWSKLGSEGLKV